METAVNINSDELRKALKAYHKRRGNTDVYLSTRRLKKSGSYISFSLSRGRMALDSLEELCRIIDVDISKIIDNAEKIESTDIKPLAYVKPSTRESAKSLILHVLKSGEKSALEVDEFVKAHGISEHTLRYAKTDLKNEGKIQYRTTSDGKGKGTVWYISLSRSSAPSYKNDVRQMLDKISEKQAEIVTAQLEINTLLCKCWEEIKNV